MIYDNEPDLSQFGGIHPGAASASGWRAPTSYARSRGWKAGHWGWAVTKQVKAIATGSITVPALTTGIVRIEDRPTRLVDVVPFGPTIVGTDSFAYLRETVRDHQGAPTPKGGQKPTSTYRLEKVDDRARAIAHLTEPIDRADLADVADAAAYIDGSLRQGVMLSLDEEIVHGDGVTGDSFRGFADPDRLTIPFDTDLIRTTRKAISLLEDEEIFGGVFVLNTHVWEELELTADNEARYYLGGPVDRARRQLWSAPVVTSSVVAETRGFYVDFVGSTELRERERARGLLRERVRPRQVRPWLRRLGLRGESDALPRRWSLRLRGEEATRDRRIPDAGSVRTGGRGQARGLPCGRARAAPLDWKQPSTQRQPGALFLRPRPTSERSD